MSLTHGNSGGAHLFTDRMWFCRKNKSKVMLSDHNSRGTALCLRRSVVTGHTVVAVLTGTFHLSPRNGSGGRQSLLQFLTFLKEKGAGLAINTFD